jgi:proteasome accessory factor C
VTDTAAAQLRRILALIPELGDDGEHPIAELVAELGTDEATLLRDLCALTDRFDDPGGFVEEGVQLFVERERVTLNSPHFRRPMRVTAGELRALELGLAMLEGERPPEEHRAIAAARDRVRQAVARLPGDDAEPRAATLGAYGRAADLRALREGLRRRRKVRLAYRRAGVEGATDRVVRPYALVVASGMWYAVAFCERSDALRVLRLDRVEGAEVLAEPYAEPADFSLDTVLRDGKVLSVREPQTLRVRYSPRVARWIAEREGKTPDADGSLTLEHPLADAEWAVRHVLQYGPDAEVLAPAEVRELVAARLAGIAAALGSGG